MAESKLEVETELDKVIKELVKIRDLQKNVGDEAKKAGEKVGESLKKQSRDALTMMESVQTFGQKVWGNLKSDIKALASLNALQGALKISNQFQGSIKESISLSDSIRKLGGTFGIAQDRFSAFKASMVKGMGDIGASSEAASRVLEGLADSTIRDEQSLVKFAKISSQLASMGREEGAEGGIAKGIEQVALRQGKNASGAGVAEGIASEVTRAQQATGIKASALLQSMQQSLDSMTPEMRKSTSTRGLVQQAAASQVGGSEIGELLKTIQNTPNELKAQFQGVEKILGKNGEMNLKALEPVRAEMKRRNMSSRMAAESMGLSGASAEGLVKLLDNADKVSGAFERLDKTSGDYEKTAKENRTLSEAWNANLNKLKGSIGTAFEAYGIGDPIKGVTDIFNKGANEETGLGSAGLVAGGGILAAILAGGGLGGIGKAMGGGISSIAKGGLASAVTGKEVQPVYVVNAGEIGAGGAAGNLMGGAGGMLAKGGGVLAAGAVGYGIGTAANSVIESSTQGKTSEGFEGNAVERLIFKMDQLLGGEGAKNISQANKVMVEVSTRDPSLRVPSKPKTTRGVTQ